MSDIWTILGWISGHHFWPENVYMASTKWASCSYVCSIWNTSEGCSSAEDSENIMGWYPSATTLASEWILIIATHMVHDTENIKWCGLNVSCFAGLSVWQAGSPVQYCAHKKNPVCE